MSWYWVQPETKEIMVKEPIWTTAEEISKPPKLYVQAAEPPLTPLQWLDQQISEICQLAVAI